MIKHKALSNNELRVYIQKIRHLKAGFDLLRHHVMVTDPNAHIVYANKAALENTGFTLDEMLGKNPADLWGGNMPMEFYQEMWKTIAIEKKPFVGDVENTSKDGTKKWVKLHISPVLDARGAVVYFIGIEPDITDEKKKAQFQEEFVSILGHQLKGPLTGIRLVLELLLDSSNLSSKQLEMIQQTYLKDMNLIGLVNDLLLVARTKKMSGALKQINLSKLIESILSDVRKKNLGVNFNYTVDVIASKVMVPTIESLAREVFTNLLTNAAEYSDRKDSSVDVTFSAEDDHLLFVCADNGIGIPKEAQKNIFSRLFRADNAKSHKTDGSGLGLFIVKMITDKFGWDVWFESTEGKGTTFFVKVLLDKTQTSTLKGSLGSDFKA